MSLLMNLRALYLFLFLVGCHVPLSTADRTTDRSIANEHQQEDHREDGG